MPNVHLISGDDEPTIHEAGRKLAESLAGPDADAFGLEVYAESDERAAEDVLQDVIGSVLTPSFMGGQKVVWLQHFSAFDSEAPKSKKPESPVQKALATLKDHIAEGLPEDIILVMDGVGVGEKKPLAVACKAKGKVIIHKKPDLKKGAWRQEVTRLIAQQAKDRGMTLGRDSVDYLAEVLGVDTGRIGMELEKIACFAGDQPTRAQIMEVCTGSREAVFWALNDAMDSRDLNASLKTVAQFMDRARNADGETIRLVRMSSRRFQDLLHARILMGYLKVSASRLGSRVQSMTDSERAAYAGNSMLNKGEWMIGKTAAAAERYSGPELVDAIACLAETDRALVSSSLPRRLLLEMTISRIITGHRKVSA